MTETRIADLDWIPSDMNYSWEGHKQCHAQVEKKIPNMVLIHVAVGSHYVPIFHYLGFLEILQGTGEDLVYQAGACAVLVTAQMQVFFCIVSNSFYAGQTQGLIRKQSRTSTANRFFMDLVKPLQQTMWTSQLQLGTGFR